MQNLNFYLVTDTHFLTHHLSTAVRHMKKEV